jgi:hypothetical protein
MFLGLSDPHPDPLDRGTDAGIQIRIRSKISRIPNTALKLFPLRKSCYRLRVYIVRTGDVPISPTMSSVLVLKSRTLSLLGPTTASVLPFRHIMQLLGWW